ncbi:hypothetical protein Tco_0867688 [Tanacetum coccineum]
MPYGTTPRAERHAWLRFDAQDYSNNDVRDFQSKLARIYDRQVHRVHVLDFDVLTEEMERDMTERLRIEHIDAQGKVLFTSYAWRAWIREDVLDFDAFDTFQFQLGGVRRRMSWRQYILELGLHTIEEMESDGFRAYRADSLREIASKADLHDY